MGLLQGSFSPILVTSVPPRSLLMLLISVVSATAHKYSVESSRNKQSIRFTLHSIPAWWHIELSHIIPLGSCVIPSVQYLHRVNSLPFSYSVAILDIRAVAAVTQCLCSGNSAACTCVIHLVSFLLCVCSLSAQEESIVSHIKVFWEWIALHLSHFVIISDCC